MSGSATPQQMPHTVREGAVKTRALPAAAQAAEQTADVLIREVMIEQKRRDSHDALPDLETDTPETQAAPIKHPRRMLRKTRAVPSDENAQNTAGLPSRALSSLFSAVGSYRPSRRHLIFAVLAAIMYFRPWLIPITLFIAFWCVLIGYLTLGPDRVAELVVGAWQRLHARRPELAETLRQRAEATATRIDAALDRVPGSWTDGLHVPDFSAPDPEVENRPDPFERLANEAQRG